MIDRKIERRENQIIAYLATKGENQNPRYFTRSMVKNSGNGQNNNLEEKLNIEETLENKNVDSGNNNRESDEMGQERIEKEKKPEAGESTLVNEHSQSVDKNDKNEIMMKIPKFDESMWYRKLENAEEIPCVELLDSEIREARDKNKFIRNNKSLLWHVRMGHPSLDYLKELR